MNPISKEAVAQSVSALCLVNLLKTIVVGSSPDDGSFCFVCFIFVFFFFFLALHLWRKYFKIVIFSASELHCTVQNKWSPPSENPKIFPIRTSRILCWFEEFKEVRKEKTFLAWISFFFTISRVARIERTGNIEYSTLLLIWIPLRKELKLSMATSLSSRLCFYFNASCTV